MSDPIQIRIKVDADEAIAVINRVSAAEQQLAEQTDKSGHVAATATAQAKARVQQTGDLNDNLNQLARAENAAADVAKQTGDETDGVTKKFTDHQSAVAGVAKSVWYLMTSWLSLTAVFATVVKGFHDIAEAADAAYKAVVKVGGELRQLAVKMGSGTDAVRDEAGAIAIREGTGVPGRDAIISAANSLTDLRPALSKPENRPELFERLNEVGKMNALKGGNGDDLAETVLTLEEAQKIPHAEAARRASVLLTNGFDNSFVQMTARRAPEMIPALLGAREHNLNPATAGRQAVALRSAIDDLVPDPTHTRRPGIPARIITNEVGIKAGTGYMDVVQELGDALHSGKITEDQLTEVTGGERVRELIDPLLAAKKSGAIDRATKLLNSETIGELRSKQRESRGFRQTEDTGSLEMRDQLTKERPAIAETARRADAYRTALHEELVAQQEAGQLDKFDAAIDRGIFESLVWLGVDAQTATLTGSGGLNPKKIRLNAEATLGNGNRTPLLKPPASQPATTQPSTYNEAFLQPTVDQITSDESEDSSPVRPATTRPAFPPLAPAPALAPPPPTIINNYQVTNVAAVHNYSVDPFYAKSGRGDR